MIEFIGGVAATVAAAIAFFILLFGNFWFLGLGSIKKLEIARVRLAELLIDAHKFSEFDHAVGKFKAEKLGVVVERHIDTLTLAEPNHWDRFKTFAVATDIVALRPRSRRRLMKEARAVSAVICIVFVLGLAWNVSQPGTEGFPSILLESPSIAVVIEDMSLVFIIYRLVVELRDAAEICGGDSS